MQPPEPAVQRLPYIPALDGLGAWEVVDRHDSQVGHLEVGTAAWRTWALEGIESTVAQLAAGPPRGTDRHRRGSLLR